MKLSKLYCNDKKFNTVIFNPRFNIVLGEITHIADLNRDSHNLGKSTLINLIDFMLLKTIDKNSFLKKKEFENSVFYLEIELNSGKYLTIRRGTKLNTKVSIKFHNERNQNFCECYEWDYDSLPLTTSDEDKNPKKIIETALGFNILQDEGYRKTSGYFFRTQDDYKDVFKLQKHQGKDVLWKPCLFELLGFSSEHMIQKYKLEEEKSEKEKLVIELKKEFKVDVGEIDKINGMISIKEAERDKIVKWLDEFDFYNKETNISKDTIENIEKSISELNTQRYNLEYDIQQIKESLEEKIDYNLEEILQIYQEVNVYFKDDLKKSYEDLLEFNRQVSSERMGYLSQSLEEKQKRIEEVENRLQQYNEQRKNMLGNLRETKTFEKYNAYRADLINIERELERYFIELESIDKVKIIQGQIEVLDKKIAEESTALRKQVEESTDVYKNIRKDFHDYVQEILNQSAILSLIINGSGNVEFNARFINTENEETAQNLGHTYRKILCACFDLAIIKNYTHKSFYRVIYHDGCLESLDPRKQKKYFELVKRLANEHDIQYIMTCLSSDVPSEEKYLLGDETVAVRLSDIDNNEGRLFGFEF